jgi:hypothetical protein
MQWLGNPTRNHKDACSRPLQCCHLGIGSLNHNWVPGRTKWLCDWLVLCADYGSMGCMLPLTLLLLITVTFMMSRGIFANPVWCIKLWPRGQSDPEPPMGNHAHTGNINISFIFYIKLQTFDRHFNWRNISWPRHIVSRIRTMCSISCGKCVLIHPSNSI